MLIPLFHIELPQNWGYYQIYTEFFFFFFFAVVNTVKLGRYIQWSLSIVDTLGTAESVLIKGGVLISGVVLYTFLPSWDHIDSIMIEMSLYQGCALEL